MAPPRVANGRWRAPLLAALAVAAAACIGPETPEPRAVTSGGGAGGADTGGACGARPAAATLPFEVSAAGFIPSGFMGDGAVDRLAIAIASGSDGCQGARAAGVPTSAVCYRFTYTPTPAATPGMAGWAGLYWQYPVNNWGMCPGRPVAPGATKVTFLAAGAAGGEKLSFIAGGISPTNALQAPYVDTFSITLGDLALTTAWTSYTIDIAGATYGGGVLGAFAWIANAPAGGAPMTFFVDDIVWQ
jgi:hypothetical protein